MRALPLDTVPAAPWAIRIAGRAWPVLSLAEASAIYRAARDAYGEGVSSMPRADVLRYGIHYGYISYNGRVWYGRPESWVPGAAPVYDPFDDDAAAEIDAGIDAEADRSRA